MEVVEKAMETMVMMDLAEMVRYWNFSQIYVLKQIHFWLWIHKACL